MRRYALRDDQWTRIEGLLPGRVGHVGMTARDNRLFVEAVLYRYRAGIPWRDLPDRFGSWKAVHTRFSRWAKGGVWERLLRHFSAEADMNTPCSTARRCALTSTLRGHIKKGLRAGHRAQQGWPEHQDPRPRGCTR
jgi:transposase